MLYSTKRRWIVGLSLILLIILYAFKNYSMMWRIIAALFSLWLFYFVDHAFDVKFHIRHYLYIIFFIIFAHLLSPLYYLYPGYDKLLHLALPILGSVLIFFLVDKLKIKFKWKLLITFTSMLAFLTVFELIEFGVDYFWDLKLQGVFLRDASGLGKYKLVMDRNDDTMIDLILGLIGAGIFAGGKTITRFFNKRSCKIRR